MKYTFGSYVKSKRDVTGLAFVSDFTLSSREEINVLLERRRAVSLLLRLMDALVDILRTNTDCRSELKGGKLSLIVSCTVFDQCLHFHWIIIKSCAARK